MRRLASAFLVLLLGLQPYSLYALEMDESVSDQEILEETEFQEPSDSGENAVDDQEELEDDLQDNGQLSDSSQEENNPVSLVGWINGCFYNFSDGSPATGWLYLDGETYYLNDQGKPYANQTITVNGKTYLFDYQGKLYKGPLADNSGSLPTFYSLFDGGQLSGLKHYDGKLYLLQGSAVPNTGLQEYNGNLMYYNGDGTFAINTVLSINGKDFYFDGNGIGTEITVPEVQQPPMSQLEAYNRQKAREILAWAGTGLSDLYWLTVNSITYQNDIFTRSMDDYARIGFDTLHGNCFTFASVFYYLASEAGYAARYVHGSVKFYTGASSEHGWVVINEGGKEYIYDPEAEKEIGKGIYHFFRMDPLRPIIGYRFPAGEEPLGGYTIVY